MSLRLEYAAYALSVGIYGLSLEGDAGLFATYGEIEGKENGDDDGDGDGDDEGTIGAIVPGGLDPADEPQIVEEDLLSEAVEEEKVLTTFAVKDEFVRCYQAAPDVGNVRNRDLPTETIADLKKRLSKKALIQLYPFQYETKKKKEIRYGIYGGDVQFYYRYSMEPQLWQDFFDNWKIPKSKKKNPYWEDVQFIGFHAYDNNDVNKRKLLKMMDCIRDIEERYRGQRIVKAEPPLDPSLTHGKLGWDFPCTVPQWVEDATVWPFSKRWKWNPWFNPTLQEENDTYTFALCGTKGKWIDEAIAYLKNHEKTMDWSRLFPRDIDFNSAGLPWNDQDAADVSAIVLNGDVAFNVGWDGHARFAQCKDGEIVFWDSWKSTENYDNDQTFQRIRAFLRDVHNTESRFEYRGFIDQAAEGSCGAVALMRTILVSQFGRDGAFQKPAKCEYVILASRLVRIGRKLIQKRDRLFRKKY